MSAVDQKALNAARLAYAYCPETCSEADRIAAAFAATLPEEHREPLRDFVYELKRATSYRLRSGLQRACIDMEALRLERDALERNLVPAWTQLGRESEARSHAIGRAERLAEALREAKRLGDQGDWRAEREVICTALRKYGQESNDA